MTHCDQRFIEEKVDRAHTRLLGTILCIVGPLLICLAFLAVYSLSLAPVNSTMGWGKLSVGAFAVPGMGILWIGARMVDRTLGLRPEIDAFAQPVPNPTIEQAQIPTNIGQMAYPASEADDLFATANMQSWN